MNKQQVSRFCYQLQMLLGAGVSLWEACQILKHLSPTNLDQALSRLSQGEALSAAFDQVLPPLVTSSLQNAEQIGNIEGALQRLGKYYEQQEETEHRVKSAMVYPIFVVILSCMSLILMLTVVLPSFKDLFADLGGDLPWLTQFVMLNSDRFVALFPYTILLTGLGLVGGYQYKKSNRGALVIDSLWLKMKFIRHYLMSEVLRNLGLLLQGGVPIITALTTVGNTTANRILRNILQEIRRAISSGKKISETMMTFNLLPAEVIQMIKVGENCGRLPQMLLAAADLLEKEREYQLKKFTALLEPVLTLIVGAIVALIALTVFLPLVNMAAKLQ